MIGIPIIMASIADTKSVIGERHRITSRKTKNETTASIGPIT